MGLPGLMHDCTSGNFSYRRSSSSRYRAGILLLFAILIATTVARATDPEAIDIALWPDPLIADLPVNGMGSYMDADSDPMERGEYRFHINGTPSIENYLPTDLLLNADASSISEGLHIPSDSSNITYTDGVWNNSFHFDGGHRLTFTDGPLSSPEEGGVDFWFRLHHDLSDSIYGDWRVFFWLQTDTGDLIYIETYIGTIYGTSYSGGQYAGAWTGTQDIQADQWHHFAYGWNADDSLAVVWIDGLIEGRSTVWPGITGNSELICLGHAPWGGQTALADMDAVRIWNRLPSNEEVQWAFQTNSPPTQCAALLDTTGLPVGTTVQYEVRVADDTGSWSAWAQSPIDTLRSAVIESLYPPPRLVAHDQYSIPLQVSTSVPCQCRASETASFFSDMETILDSPDGLTHTTSWTVDSEDEFHEIAVRCSSLAGDIDPNLIPVSTGYRQLRDYNPSYPRIALLWGNYDSELGLDFYSGYSLIITSIWSGFNESVQQSLRSMNPDLKILTTGYISYGGPPMSEWIEITDPENPKFNWVLRDPDGDVILESYWGHGFYNLTDSSCVEWLVRYNVDRWRETNLAFDGVYFDRVHDFISHISDDIDSDQDGSTDDPAVLDSIWSNGMEYYLQSIRDIIPNEIICGNDTPLHFGPYINGRLFEMGLANVMDAGGSWLPILEEYASWEDIHREPYCLPIVCNQAPLDFLYRWGLEPWNSVPADSVEWVRTFYQRMRFGLGTTLLSEGVSVYDFGTTWWGNPWWYDEYDIDLGYPVSNPYRLTDQGNILVHDDFEDGSPGNYTLNQWGPMYAEITDVPTEVIHGSYSLKGGNTSMSQTWNEFAHSNLDSIPLFGDSTYTVSFSYKILEPPVSNGYFYFFARSVTGGVASDVGHQTWTGNSGDIDSLTATFTLESYDDYYLVFGLKYTGAYSVDDISVARGGGGLWRRDFVYGTVVINPAGMYQTIELGDTLYRFLGIQDPVHNNGQAVTSLTLQGYDAILLLENGGGSVPGPVLLQISDQDTDVILSWTASSGASGYHVYRSDHPWFPPEIIYRITSSPVTTLEYTDTGVLGDPEIPVFYTVRAINNAGFESIPSNRVGGMSYNALSEPTQIRIIKKNLRCQN